MSDLLKSILATVFFVVLIAAVGLAALSYPSGAAIELLVNLFVGLAAFVLPIGLALQGRVRWFAIGFCCAAAVLFGCSLVPALRMHLFTETIARELWRTVFSKRDRVMPPEMFHLASHLILSLVLGCLCGFVTQLLYAASSIRRQR